MQKVIQVENEVTRRKRGLAVVILATMVLIVLVSGCALKDTFSSAKNANKFGEGPNLPDKGTIVDQQEGNGQGGKDSDHSNGGNQPGKNNEGGSSNGSSDGQTDPDKQTPDGEGAGKGEQQPGAGGEPGNTTPPEENHTDDPTSTSNPNGTGKPGEPGSTAEPDGKDPDKAGEAGSGKDGKLPNVGSDKPNQPDNKKKVIALTFDDGPDIKYTPAILDTLKEKGVKATFFVVGSQVEKYPDIMKRIVEEGHALGNHSFGHKDLTKLNKTQILNQIESTDKAIKAAIGFYPKAFRAPYGALNAQVKKVLEEKGRYHVGWSVDTRDWAGTPIDEMRENIKTNSKDKGIILMHSFGGKHIQNTVDMLADVIDDLEKLGYSFVTTDELK